MLVSHRNLIYGIGFSVDLHMTEGVCRRVVAREKNHSAFRAFVIYRDLAGIAAFWHTLIRCALNYSLSCSRRRTDAGFVQRTSLGIGDAHNAGCERHAKAMWKGDFGRSCRTSI